MEVVVRWEYYDLVKPALGDKISIVCDDGCSCSVALVTDDGILEGEDAWRHSDDYLKGSIWIKLPDDYALAFTEMTEDDWR